MEKISSVTRFSWRNRILRSTLIGEYKQRCGRCAQMLPGACRVKAESIGFDKAEPRRSSRNGIFDAPMTGKKEVQSFISFSFFSRHRDTSCPSQHQQESASITSISVCCSSVDPLPRQRTHSCSACRRAIFFGGAGEKASAAPSLIASLFPPSTHSLLCPRDSVCIMYWLSSVSPFFFCFAVPWRSSCV